MPEISQQSHSIIELNAMPTEDVIAKITEALSSLVEDKAITTITIAYDAMTAQQAEAVVALVESDKRLTATINLPPHLQDTRAQISLDNRVSNNRLEQYQKEPGVANSSIASPASPTIEQRVLPKKRKPKIEITLSEQYLTEASMPQATTSTSESTALFDSALPQLTRSPMAESVVSALLSLPSQESNRREWEGISTRAEALAFRKELTNKYTLADHPLPELIKANDKLSKRFAFWQKELHFEKEQLDALLDVYGQRGEAGLQQLFATWDAYNADQYQRPAFLETYHHLLKHMPTYLPFIDDPEVQRTIGSIATQGKDQQSFWMALIQNHGQTTGYSHLPTLFKQCTQAVNAIADMGLSFHEIKTIQNKKDLPTTLKDILQLLQKCHKEDRVVQWQCIDRITIPTANHYHFIIPEMQINSDSPANNDIESIKESLKQNKNADPRQSVPLFYRYLAQQEHHLPLATYRTIINDLLNNSELDNEIKTRMIYVLAKTTSTQEKAGFDPQTVFAEWELFKNAIVKLDSLDRLKANRDYLGGKAFTAGIAARGGLPAVRVKTISPIMDMPVTPPMSYLNKLMRLSEYKFLDEKLSLLQLEGAQDEMMKVMNQAAVLYKDHPTELMQAIRLIKTDTLEPNENKKFIANAEDIELLERFVAASKALLAPGVNSAASPALNPQTVLLPLLTVFHLEYESAERLNNEVIRPYQQRISASGNETYKEKIQLLLPYGLSLLQLAQQRKEPSRLDYKTLNNIQQGLITLICTPAPLTKKEIREWMHQHYGDYFPTNLLLDIKDQVDFSELLNELGCRDEKTCRGIEQLVSNFNNPDEKDQHADLVKSLVTLTKTLTETQRTEFFEFCDETFKTEGLLSREKHPGPPSYLLQFKTLVESISQNNYYNEFRQYMSVAQESLAEEADATNSLAKCTYLLNTLYPKLMRQGIPQKDAFIFASQITSTSTLQELEKSHEPIAIATPDFPEALQLNSSVFNFLKDPHGSYQFEKLRQVQHDLEALIKCSNNPEHFKTCRAVNARMLELLNKANAPSAPQTTLQWLAGFLWSAPAMFRSTPAAEPKKSELTAEELQSLVTLGFTAQLTAPESDTYRDWQAIQQEQTKQFDVITVHLYQKKMKLVNTYPNITIRANDFINKALHIEPNNINKNYNNVSMLVDNLLRFNDQNIVLSLMYHYAGGLTDRGVQDLIDLFQNAHYEDLSAAQQKNVTQAIISQMNNSVPLSKEDIHEFLNFIHQHKDNEQCQRYLHQYYQHAPFPRLNDFMDWMQDEASIASNYAQFDKSPCATKDHNGREAENGFDLKQAETILNKMPEVQALFSQNYRQSIAHAQERARKLTTQELLDELKEFKTTPPKNHVTLVMHVAELMHRCKGRPPVFVGNTQMLGRSYELNTTQIIAILSLLDSGQKVTAEIGTGEGKSRIMMILNACQFLKGNTVDFLTSDLALAERDYLESLTFFNSLGADVNFITATSRIEDYKVGGINFSDPENLCLFRNKAFSTQRSKEVTAPDPTKQALLLDEADVTYFDVANLGYHYSSKIPQRNIDILPLFPLLMDFFAQSDTEQTYLENKQRCNQQLLAFVESRNPSLFELLKSMPISQLEQLQDAAYSARHLECNVDYTVVTDATIPGALGEKKVAAAMCLVSSRISRNSNFADGVHQCLHAELNRLMKMQSTAAINPSLQEALEQCKAKGRAFTVSPQKDITYTSSSSTLLKIYSKGSIHAVTGTIGLDAEQHEAKSVYGSEFITVPRHKGMRRFDRPTRIMATADKQIDALVEHILESYANNQPVLLVCKNDSESAMVHKALSERLPQCFREKSMPTLTRIHAGLDYTKESHYIKTKAGAPGNITITTAMEGRGVDIELQNKAKAVGLKVLLTYLPHGKRDYGQIIGRSGRYGALGETQMVLNMDSLQEDFGIDKLNKDFYLNPEDFISKLQVFASHTNELRRLFHRVYDNFLTQFSEVHTQLNTMDADLTEAWVEFLAEYNKTKEASFNNIIAELEQSRPNIAAINVQLILHNNTVQQLWGAFVAKLPQEKQEIARLSTIALQKPQMLEQWLEEMEQIKQESITIKYTRHHIRVQENYDPTAAGQVQLVKNPEHIKSFIANLGAWWRGDGFAFPNLSAWRAGHLSLSNLLSQQPLLSWFFKPQEEQHTGTKNVPAAHAALERIKVNTQNVTPSTSLKTNIYHDNPLRSPKVRPTEVCTSPAEPHGVIIDEPVPPKVEVASASPAEPLKAEEVESPNEEASADQRSSFGA